MVQNHESPLTPDEHWQTFTILKRLTTTLGNPEAPAIDELGDLYDEDEMPTVESAHKLVLDVASMSGLGETFSDLYDGESLHEATTSCADYAGSNYPSAANLATVSIDADGVHYSRFFDVTAVQHPTLVDATVDTTYTVLPNELSPLRSSVEESEPMTSRQARLVQTLAALALLDSDLKKLN